MESRIEAAHTGSTPKTIPVRSLVVFLLTTTLAVFLVIGGVSLISARAFSRDRLPAAPLVVVEATTAQPASGYQRMRTFVGRVEPAQQTDLAFELSGKLSKVLVEEGDVLVAGQPVAKLDTRSLRAQLASQQAARKTLESDLALSKLTLQRQENLKKKGFAATQALDEAQFSTQRISAAIEQVNASILSIELDIGKATLTAPFDATVGKRLVDTGAIVTPGMTVVTLFDSGLPTVRVGLAPDLLAGLSADANYTVKVGRQSLEARLLSTRPDLAVRTRTVDTRFELLLDGVVPPPFGQVAELQLGESVGLPGFWVPVASLLEGDRSVWSVYTASNTAPADPDAPRSIVRESVELVYTDGERAFVKGQFDTAAQIVAMGTHRVVPGQQVLLAGQGE